MKKGFGSWVVSAGLVLGLLSVVWGFMYLLAIHTVVVILGALIALFLAVVAAFVCFAHSVLTDGL